ncbi:hypothetical protein C0J52_18704 [Blattella germanica]|nr:hypothetical protein C0J52_18704 [Blattella germanica]
MSQTSSSTQEELELLEAKEKSAGCSYKNVIINFLGNQKAKNYMKLVEIMVICFQTKGSHMSPKLHYLQSHLNFFPESLGVVVINMGRGSIS